MKNKKKIKKKRFINAFAASLPKYINTRNKGLVFFFAVNDVYSQLEVVKWKTNAAVFFF